MHCERVNRHFDYAFRAEGDVLRSALILPENCRVEFDGPEHFANCLEDRETRCDSQVGRHLILPAPHLLSDDDVWKCGEKFGRNLAEKFDLASFMVQHGPGKGDPRNKHLHYVMSRRRLTPDGFGATLPEFDKYTLSKATLTDLRLEWRRIVNRACGSDCPFFFEVQSFSKLGIDLESTRKLGPRNAAVERAAPGSTRVGQHNAAVAARNEAKAAGLGMTVQAMKDAPPVANVFVPRKRKASNFKSVGGYGWTQARSKAASKRRNDWSVGGGGSSGGGGRGIDD